MTKDVWIEEHCPVLEDDCAIKIRYIRARALAFDGFTKDQFWCDRIKECPLLNPQECPLYNSAPLGTPL